MSIDLERPIRLSRAGAWRTYKGGSLIEKLHGNLNAPDTNFPEEWIMSTVCARNAGREDIIEGLTMIEGTNISLASLIEENPIDILGKKHYERFGCTTGVLVKLLDSAERLTIQVHPTREKAKALFGSDFGKTECWHVIDGREINGEKPCIYFGFKEGITRERWKKIFDEQNIPEMLECLHKFEVSPGDTFLIEGGIPHAIGAGCFLIEIQEPTDYTIRTERVTPNGLEVADVMCHQGLGFEQMFDCFEYNGYSKEETGKMWRIEKSDNTVIGYNNTKMFGLELDDVNGDKQYTTHESFYGIYVLEGEGYIDETEVIPGSQFLISAVCRPFKVSGNMKLMCFFGPFAD